MPLSNKPLLLMTAASCGSHFSGLCPRLTRLPFPSCINFWQIWLPAWHPLPWATYGRPGPLHSLIVHFSLKQGPLFLHPGWLALTNGCKLWTLHLFATLLTDSCQHPFIKLPLFRQVPTHQPRPPRPSSQLLPCPTGSAGHQHWQSTTADLCLYMIEHIRIIATQFLDPCALGHWYSRVPGLVWWPEILRVSDS